MVNSRWWPLMQSLLELDDHGNAFDPKIKDSVYEKYAPQMGEHNHQVFNENAEPMRLSASTILHTLQHSSTTYEHIPRAQQVMGGPTERQGHREIQGPIHESTSIPIVIHQGRPILVDGHHRLAEMRGRGMTHFNAQVFNADQFEARLPRAPHPSPEQMFSHMLDSHVVPSGMMRSQGQPLSPSRLGALHDEEHNSWALDHRH